MKIIKKTKLISFAIMIFSTIIFSVQQFWWLSIFLPLYPIIYFKSSKFCTNFDLFEFAKLRRCSSTIWTKNCFCSSSVVMLLLKDCIKATPRSAASLVTFSPRTIDNPFWKSCKNAALILDLDLSASVADSCCIFTLAVRQPPVLASCI